MLDKTVEQLKKELHSAKALVNYHKNKNKPKKTKNIRRVGESPQARENRLASGIAWNDNKRAMARVIARLTANDADYKEAANQAYLMPVADARELVKGYEAEVEKEVKALQDDRKAKAFLLKESKRELDKMIDGWGSELEPKPEPKPEPVQTVPVCVPLEDAKKIHTPIKRELLSLAQKVVLAESGFEDLSSEQVVGYVLNRYLKYNKKSPM